MAARGPASSGYNPGRREIPMRTVILLVLSNVFMTVAWYGHLKFKGTSLWLAIAASWLIALPEYCLQVPANRWGHGQFSAFQLKIIQEIVTLVVFSVFAVTVLKEPPKWNYVVSFLLILGAVYFAFLDRTPVAAP
jgi:uncharacterized protein